MLSTEWNLEDALRVCKEETRKENLDLILHLMNQARSMNELKKMVEESFSGKMEQSAPPLRRE